MNIPIMLKLLHTLEPLRRHECWTRPQLEAYQAESLRRLREYAYAHSPFYQRFHQGFTDRPLHELPVLTKAMMMEHFDELVTDRAIRLEDVRAHAANDREGARHAVPFLDRYWVNATSGSSGQPGFFLFDESEWLTVLASFARAHEWAGIKVSLTHRMKMASVASVSPWHMSAQVGATLKSWWMPALRLAASEPLETIVQRLNAWQPEMLIAYASMARILADEQIAGRLRIQPHLIYTSSEVLTDETRRRVEAAWGQAPFNQYASTETAGIAAEHQACRRLHLFEDLVIVEGVDEHHRPVPAGVYGARLLVTTLFSHTQPLIRYELNDSVRLATEACPCGLPFAWVDGIQGRVGALREAPLPCLPWRGAGSPSNRWCSIVSWTSSRPAAGRCSRRPTTELALSLPKG
jgi:putative adenylate-forming enzyme